MRRGAGRGTGEGAYSYFLAFELGSGPARDFADEVLYAKGLDPSGVTSIGVTALEHQTSGAPKRRFRQRSTKWQPADLAPLPEPARLHYTANASGSHTRPSSLGGPRYPSIALAATTLGEAR